MKRTRALWTDAVAVVTIVVLASDAGAQELREGDRIRVTTISGQPAQVTGVFRGSETESLTIHVDGSAQAMVPYGDISRLQRSRGFHNNAAKGALIGGAGGAAFGIATGILAASQGDSFWDAETGEVLLFTLVTGATGAGLGALIGLAIKSEKWETVPREQWRIQVAPDPRGGVAIGLNLRL